MIVTRKEFIKSSLAFSIGSMAPAFSFGNSSGTAFFNFKKPLISFDLHAHPGRLFARGSNEFGPSISPEKAFDEMKESNLTGAFIALVADAKLIKLGMTGVTVTGKFKPGEGWLDYKSQLEYLKLNFENYHFHPATSADDLKQNKNPIVYISIEGADYLEGQIEKLDESYKDGVRSIQLVHYAPNELGDLQTAVPVYNGLSSFGKEVVKRMNDLGLLIDVAHASFKTCKDVVDHTDAPIMLSHSILQLEPERPLALRAISKEHAKLIASTGGIIGAWPSGFNKSFDEYAENIFRLIDVVGINHVGIGTDMDANFKPVLNNYSQFITLRESLKNKGLSMREINKIMGANAFRVLKQVLK